MSREITYEQVRFSSFSELVRLLKTEEFKPLSEGLYPHYNGNNISGNASFGLSNELKRAEAQKELICKVLKFF